MRTGSVNLPPAGTSGEVSSPVRVPAKPERIGLFEFIAFNLEIMLDQPPQYGLTMGSIIGLGIY